MKFEYPDFSAEYRRTKIRRRIRLSAVTNSRPSLIIITNYTRQYTAAFFTFYFFMFKFSFIVLLLLLSCMVP